MTGAIRYRNRDRTPDGRGAALPLPALLPAGDTYSAALVAHPGLAVEQCWGGAFPIPSISSPTRAPVNRAAPA